MPSAPRPLREPDWPLPERAWSPGQPGRPAPLDPATVQARGFEACLRRGLDLLDHGYPWEAHELLELLWRPATGADRSLLQGLIQVGAARLRLQAGDARAAETLLVRATAHLAAASTSPWAPDAEADARLSDLAASLRAKAAEPASTLRERPRRG